MAVGRGCHSETHESQLPLHWFSFTFSFGRHIQPGEDTPVTPRTVQCWPLLLHYHEVNVNGHSISYHTCRGLGPVTPVVKMMSLFSSSYGHLKSRWGKMGRRCACAGRELIAWHGSAEHLRNQCSGKSVWAKASSDSVFFFQWGGGKEGTPISSPAHLGWHTRLISFVFLFNFFSECAEQAEICK